METKKFLKVLHKYLQLYVLHGCGLYTKTKASVDIDAQVTRELLLWTPNASLNGSRVATPGSQIVMW